MEHVAPRLMLITPLLALDGGWTPRLEAACKSGHVAAVLLRFQTMDERSIINIIKDIAPPLQALDIAVIAETEAGIAMRGGADGIHISANPEAVRAARKAMPKGRSIGTGQLRSRHDAMDAGEADVDYVMFGEPRPDGSIPPLSATLDRASWWAEIFHTPCVAYAHDLDMVGPLSATRAEFIALGEWVFDTADPAAMIRSCAAAMISYLPTGQTAIDPTASGQIL